MWTFLEIFKRSTAFAVEIPIFSSAVHQGMNRAILVRIFLALYYHTGTETSYKKGGAG